MPDFGKCYGRGLLINILQQTNQKRKNEIKNTKQKVAHRSAKKIYPRKQLRIAKHKFDKVN